MVLEFPPLPDIDPKDAIELSLMDRLSKLYDERKAIVERRRKEQLQREHEDRILRQSLAEVQRINENLNQHRGIIEIHTGPNPPPAPQPMDDIPLTSRDDDLREIERRVNLELAEQRERANRKTEIFYEACERVLSYAKVEGFTEIKGRGDICLQWVAPEEETKEQIQHRVEVKYQAEQAFKTERMLESGFFTDRLRRELETRRDFYNNPANIGMGKFAHAVLPTEDPPWAQPQGP